ncbi:TAXI family TRAP transporter solute-binding subunit [Agarivorans sp. MS3-6]|uniref:TAXI family TRAP transporter solute-binding subunit n=1 Tax=Agarivorans sp. TSD2052 TaxID=2937286 RepID=UPI00200E31A4|nr:TAXI family TRAP transporter solute-binding subunit [Agarivorans sp. TSD2052]UPW20640.1 TAXI family TRAP transporter solute-binding subunit [Agarivorans sp. TSD2052]
MKRFTACLVFTALSLSSGLASSNEYLFVGTGNVSGVYYPTGNALCRLLEQSNEHRKISCTAESSGGSSDNVEALQSNDIDLAIVQSDVHWQAYQGAGQYEENGAYTDMRSLLSLYSEAFTVLVHEDVNISQIDQLKGHSVNVGPVGSGQYSTMKLVMEQLDWQDADFSELTNLKPDEQSRALCSKKNDAIVYVVGHPNTSITRATTMCESKLLGLSKKTIVGLAEKYEYFSPVTIKGGTYHGNPTDIQSIGVSATLVADKMLSEQTVYNFVAAIFENINTLRSLHPALAELNVKEMIATNLSAPLHPGALRYYQEQGWM